MSEERKAAVLDGELVYTSVSAMQKADGCLRQWRFRYVERLPDKAPSKGQTRGTEGHGRIAKYLLTGVNILDALELKGLSMMPEPNVGPDGTPHPVPLLVEEHFGSPTPIHADGVPMTGYMDLVNPRTIPDDGILRIRDWKFKKKLKQYAATAAELIDPTHEAGIQMLGYAAWAVRAKGRFPDFARIELSHGNFQTEPIQTVPPPVVAPLLTLTEAVQRWETVSRRIVPRQREAAKAQSPYDVSANYDICEKYGGCPYKTNCLSRMSRIASNLKNQRKKKNEMGMLSSVLNQPIHNASAATIPTPPPAQPPAQQAPPARAAFKITDVSTVLLAKNAVAGLEYRMEGCDRATFVGMTAAGDYATFKPAGGMPFIVAPEKEIVEIAAPKAAPVETPAPVTPPADVTKFEKPAETAAETKAKRGPGRPKKDVSEPIQNASASTPEASVDRSGVHLYFGCAPLGVATTSLLGFADAVEKATLDAGFDTRPDERPVDIRTSSDSTFGFGKWKGFFAAMAKETPLAAGHYVVSYGDERVECAAQTLVGQLPAGNVTLGGGR